MAKIILTKGRVFNFFGTTMILSIMLSVGRAQISTYGNTFVFKGGETSIHSILQTFSSSGIAPMAGIVGTDRVAPRGFVGFIGTAAWSSASNSAHIDGYAKSYMTTPFIFPIGDNGFYRPVRVSSASVLSPVDAAYFRANPSIAITSSLKGGNESALPNGTYNIMSKSSEIFGVSDMEYWDINGLAPVQISLTWDASSNIGTLTENNLNRLTIVGWNGNQWVVVPSTVDFTSVLGGTSSMTTGSITTNSPLVPNTYDVYTFGMIEAGFVNLLNNDIAIGYKGEPILGDVRTNDIVATGTTYGPALAAVNNPSNAQLNISPDGKFTFNTNVHGIYEFTVFVCAPGQTTGCPFSTLIINVLDPTRTDNKPIVTTDYTATMENTLVSVDVLSNDASGNVGILLNRNSLAISVQPKRGSAVVNANGTITYTPNTGFLGLDTLTYSVCDAATPPNCGSAWVIINVTNLQVAHVNDDVASGSGVLTGNTITNDKFPVGSKPRVVPQTVVLTGKGTLRIDSTGKFTWTPEVGYSGVVSFPITTCDGNSPEKCYSSTLYIVSSNQLLYAAIPNYISPNGDGLNDVWNLDGLLYKYPNAKAIIYNRWGNIVWRSTGAYGKSTSGKNVWYGQQEGSQNLVPDGVYYYLLELDDEFGTTKTGFIEIMRQ